MDDNQASVESREVEERKGSARLVALWLDAIATASKEEENWRKRAKEVVETYRDEKERTRSRFHVLYANVETQLPAIYNSPPIPDVRVRFGDKDGPAKVAARVLERALSHCGDAYDLDGCLEQATQDMLLPGRGVARVRYEPTITQEPVVGPDGQPVLGEDGQPQTQDRVVYEAATTEYVAWENFRRGPGKVWADVPWNAYRHFLTREQLRQLSPELGDRVNLDADIRDEATAKADSGPAPEIFKRALVWEVWDKERREVLFIAPSFPDAPIRTEKDPLGLEGFFDCPEPLYANRTTDSLVPLDDFKFYEDQARELDEVTRRITALVKVMKWRGIYAASAEGSGAFAALQSAEDGELVPAPPELLAVAMESGLDKAVFIMPIQDLVPILQQLYAQRDQIRAVIHELTGVADIMRGASDPNETLGAQQIKANWGSLRVQRRQRRIAKFARDLFRLKAEIIAERFSPQTLQLLTGEQITPEVHEILKRDVLRSYKIDIETDSTIRADLTRAQENMNLFLQGTAQYIAAVGPAVQAGQMPQDVAVEIFTAFARAFKLGKQAEDALDRMGEQAQAAAQQPQPNPAQEAEAAKAQAEQQKMQMEMAAQQQKLQADMQAKQAEHQMKLQLLDAQLQAKQMELELKEREMDLRQREMQMKAVADERALQIKSEAAERQAQLGAEASEHKHMLGMDMMERKAAMAAQPKEAAQ